MKPYFSSLLLFLFLSQITFGQEKSSLKFAVVTDTHIGKNANSEGLSEIVDDINKNHPEVEFVLHAGDISDFGYDHALTEAKQLMDDLDVPYYIVPGNHDTGWSSSGGVIYDKLWKEQKFVTDIEGVRFIGFSTGPYGRMSRGYVPLDQMRWLDSLVKTTPAEQPVVFLTHYPLNKGLSNYKEVIGIMQEVNTVALFCGHGHANKLFNYEGIPGIMSRTAQKRGGTLAYNIVNLQQDSLVVKQIEVGVPAVDDPWARLDISQKMEQGEIPIDDEREAIPDAYRKVEALWTYQDEGNIVSTPVVWEENVLYGNLLGEFKSLNPETGSVNWRFDTGQPIYASPELVEEQLIFASADSTVYSLHPGNGKLLWEFKTNAPVLASPVVKDKTVYIGSSDSTFRALDLKTGKQLWAYTDLESFPASKPAVGEDKIVFGTWGKTLYALNRKDGSLAWKWVNTQKSRYYSPAMVVPVIQNGKVYIVAPDEKLRGFDLTTGEQVYVSDQFRVRESLGGNPEREWLVAKTMQDSVVAWSTKSSLPEPVLNISAGFGNDFSASMPVFEDELAFFGTTFGRIYAVNIEEKKILWAYQLSEDMINTVRVIRGNRVIATSVDGKIVILRASQPVN